jgi:hypothetical protein
MKLIADETYCIGTAEVGGCSLSLYLRELFCGFTDSRCAPHHDEGVMAFSPSASFAKVSAATNYHGPTQSGSELRFRSRPTRTVGSVLMFEP